MWFDQNLLFLPIQVAGISWSWFLTMDFFNVAILTVFAAFLILEICLAQGERLNATLRQSYRTNLYTFIFNNVLMSILSISSLLALAEHYGHPGLLSRLDSPWAKAAISFVLFDLTLYIWHKANHRFGWLWTFHRVHHSDRSMNVSTAFRLHFMELLLTTFVKAAFIVIMGVEVSVVAASEAVIGTFVMFHHANITFRAEKWLSRLIIVPSLHRVHHSTLRKEHDSNYGFVFSIWDRVFRTFSKLQPTEIGLRYVGAQNFFELLRFGLTHGATPNPQSLYAMTAEAAYYRAQRRGFSPGSELLDWLDAEKEMTERLSRP
ncbi:MAG: sterol desaturase family protein [Pseudomonadota bacterium]